MKVKLVKEVTLEITDANLPKKDKLVSLSLYECNFCHWQFFGDMFRCGYGYTLEGKQTPHYCPGCGIKIDL